MTKEDLNILSGCALRYALGRMTYITELVGKCLERNLSDIRSDIKQSMLKDIKEALDTNRAGMQMDRDVWESLKNAIEAENKE